MQRMRTPEEMKLSLGELEQMDLRTATELAMGKREMDERSIHERMRWFSEKYTEGMDKRTAAEFHADLMMVVQAIHHDASRETYELLKRSLAAMPPAQFFVKPKE